MCNTKVEFQFGKAMWSKESRKHLHAGSCEYCRDFYEGLNPMPPSLCICYGTHPYPHLLSTNDEHQKVIEEHKHESSPHHQWWEWLLNPPGYFEIGFPVTQEAAEINS
ncbi:uncharacterized protein LAESUDRAFT_758778 [Laetiporus sulphureus 93-53]|uniref:DNA endonuclease activator Ctp1 C-terminal domain-containing protein n=1 Tax=Laetiporus sulphureus 93-53 TaxID=1314785 RepID=A0A165EFM8_9APHY|nr:uncharacterized protein LAESUDRAFT_758778 [Laetiporus sulphureus 93-53]KZT06958.1 hypothetical protein LAESUDRAFT_758778 [Laetiporus sulphureus 93-53]